MDAVIKELLLEARSAIRELPHHRKEIIDLYSVAVGEIEDGGSVTHEYELFMGCVEEIRKKTLTGV